ncbi:MAG: aminotransferase class V-fold PLP-dependent enzyme, partial [Bryobacteraceae bacterium]
MTQSALWQQYREQFPVTEKLIYLNHAAVSPLSKPSAEAMRWLATDGELYGSLHYDQWMASYESLRQVTAAMINAHRDEIAIVKNTSEGIATIAMGIDWKPGDRVIVFNEEFPANLYPWQKLEVKGVELRRLSVYDPLEKVEEACRGARLLALSFVQYLSGYRADLTAVGEICRRHGVFYFVDAIQGMGAFPLDVRASHIDALAADGHKWLTGPEGCGVLYVRKEVQEQVEPVEFGWTNVAKYADYSSRDMSLRSDAGRYEPGTLNTIGIYGLLASMKLLLDVGIERISEAVQGLGDRLSEAAQAKGYEIMGQRTAATGAGIVSIRKEGVDARMV